MEDELLKPMNYKIGQAAKILGVKAYVLRYWETEFEQIKPIRTPSGQRLYPANVLEIIKRIKHLLYEKGLTIEGARKQLENEGQQGLLREIEQELLAIREMLK